LRQSLIIFINKNFQRLLFNERKYYKQKLNTNERYKNNDIIEKHFFKF